MAAKQMLVSDPDVVIPTPRSDKERVMKRENDRQINGATFEVAVDDNWKAELQVCINPLK